MLRPLVNLLLESNLKDFLTQSQHISFLAVLGDDEFQLDNCLWTGLIGSVPGHPILLRMIAYIFGAVSHEEIQDKDIQESLFCGTAATPLWKYRLLQAHEILFGSCAFGRIVNEYRNVDPFDTFCSTDYPDPASANNFLRILLVRWRHRHKWFFEPLSESNLSFRL